MLFWGVGPLGVVESEQSTRFSTNFGTWGTDPCSTRVVLSVAAVGVSFLSPLEYLGLRSGGCGRCCACGVLAESTLGRVRRSGCGGGSVYGFCVGDKLRSACRSRDQSAFLPVVPSVLDALAPVAELCPLGPCRL